MDDCKGVGNEFDSQGTSQCVAHDFGRAFLELLGWASPALVLMAFVVLAFGVHAPKAYALSAKSSPEMVIDGNMVGDDAGSKGYLCVNCSPYTATLELIGHYGDLIQITDEQYDWLMGGNNPFHTLADKWKELKGGEGDEPTNTWMGGDDFLDGWLILAGKGNCWYGTFTDQQIRNAEIAFNSIMQGGTGGSSGGQTSGEKNIMQAYRWNSPNDGVVFGSTRYYVNRSPLTPSELELTFNSSVTNYINGKTGYDVLVTLNCYNGYLYILLVPTDNYTLHYTATSYSGGTNDVPTSVTVEGTYYLASARWVNAAGSVENDIAYYVMPEGNVSFATKNSGGESFYNISYFTSTDSGGDKPDVPKPPYDPEPPSPTPPTPDPPKPKDPTPRDPTPKPDPPRVYPKIDLPDVHITTEPTNTEPTDYTPWLRVIYQELKSFHVDFGTYFQDLLDELENHCQHIRDEISTQASYLGDCIEDVANEVSQQGNNLSNTIWEYADWLSKYMDAFGEWLVEHLDWNNEVNVDPYDDTSLMYWLRRIYTKLGGSSNPINTRPTDPVTNPKDTGNWLNELWETILKELAQVFPNLMIDLGLIFDDLKSKFPFSIPWDIHALLLLLVTEPVAPHFTIPMYALSTSYELEVVGEYDIDLSFYTDYLMGVHLMLEIAWIGYMLKHTKDYMELIEAVIPS